MMKYLYISPFFPLLEQQIKIKWSVLHHDDLPAVCEEERRTGRSDW